MPEDNTTEKPTVDKTVASLFDAFEDETIETETSETSEEVNEEVDEETEETGETDDESVSEEDTDDDSSTTEKAAEDDEKKTEKEIEGEDVPKFFKDKPEEQSDIARAAQEEYDKRQAKDQAKALEKENQAYKEIFERFQTQPLQMLRELYGPDVVAQLQELEKDDKDGGMKQTNRAMQQRIEKLERERETEQTQQEKTVGQEEVQAEFQRYTGMLQDYSARDEFELARQYCKHQGLDIVQEASIFAGRSMEMNPDVFVEPIDALRSIQEYAERLRSFNTKEKTDGADNADKTPSAKDKTPKTKKKKKPSTLRNEDGQNSGDENVSEENSGSTKQKYAKVDKLFDEFEREQ